MSVFVVDVSTLQPLAPAGISDSGARCATRHHDIGDSSFLFPMDVRLVDSSGTYVPAGGGGAVTGSVAINDGATPANKVSALAPGTAGALFALAVQGVAGGVAQPISAAALPLPTGAATSANQPVINGDGGAQVHVVNTVTVTGTVVTSNVTIANVGGKTGTVAVTPTITASSAYAAKNVVGGLITFSSALLTAQSGIVQSVVLKCKSVQTAGFELYLFTSNPSNTTWTDKSAAAINAADVFSCEGPIPLTVADSNLGTCTYYLNPAVGLALNAGTTTLYGVLITTGTPTFASTSDLQIQITLLQD